MKLLICTQAVDRNDPVLGFFHHWIEEFATHCESVTVICLREGEHMLPANVKVLSLGKESGKSYAKYVSRFLKYIWKERSVYDSVFVHMNQEYVLMGGILWRVWGKQVWMWRNHKMGNWLTRIAVFLSHRVFCTSRASFTSQFQNVEVMPVGIDTELFSPGAVPQSRTILFFGRLDPVKKVREFVSALLTLHADMVDFTATICGEPTAGNEEYAVLVQNQGKALVDQGKLKFLPGVTNREAPELYRAHSLYVNLTPSGSFDKTILEAGASGCLPIVVNDALSEVVPASLQIQESPVGALVSALILPEAERAILAQNVRLFVEKEHSLKLLVNRILDTS